MLKAATAADLDFLYAIESDKALWSFSEDTEMDSDKLKQILIDRIHDEVSHNFIILLNNDKQTPIGRINTWIYNKKNRIWEISYAVLPAYQGQGYCTEALKLLMDFAFSKLNAHKLVGTCNEHNIHSAAVMQKIGMIKEGVFRERLYWNGRWVDQFFFGILEREYESSKPSSI